MGWNSPPIFDEITEVIGDEAARRLSLRFRGLRIYILKSYNDQHPVVEAIGRENADKLSEHFFNMAVVVPSRLGLKAEVYRLADSGNFTRTEIAEQLFISERQVYRWLDEREKGRHQMDLFEPSASLLSIDS
jgi:DNA-binding transcriptional regulator LsrR (DeoR family)